MRGAVSLRHGVAWGAAGMLVAAVAMSAAPSGGRVATTVVEVSLLGDPAETAALRDAIELGATRRGLSVSTSAAGSAALARVTIDLRAAVPTVTVTDARDGTVLARREVPRTGSPEVLREELAAVVESALDAARSRAPAIAAPPPVPPPETSAASSASAPPSTSAPTPNADVPSPGVRVDLGVLGETRVGSGPAAFGVGALGAVTGRGPLRPSATLLATFTLPHDTSTAPVELHLGGFDLRALFGLRLAGSGAFALEAHAGPGLDLARVSPETREAARATIEQRGTSTRATPLVTALLAGRARVGPLAVFAGAGVDTALVTRSYVVTGPAGRDALHTTSRVTPLFVLGASVPLNGGDDE